MGKGERRNGDKENKNNDKDTKRVHAITGDTLLNCLYVNKKTHIYCRTNNTDQSLQRKETLK